MSAAKNRTEIAMESGKRRGLRDDSETEEFVGDLRVQGSKVIEPDPHVVEALIQDYPMAASIADLVDNSIDAGARNILIRFVKAGDDLVSVCVADDGRGMDDATIDRAMKFAGRRAYGARDLGMFGIGLKSASLSQAEVVTVLSKASGSQPTGRQWIKANIKKKHWECYILARESVDAQLLRYWGKIGQIKGKGTVVRWDRVKDFLRLRDGLGSEYLDNTFTKIRNHIGLKLHRFLERRVVSIVIDTEDISTGAIGPPSKIEALRPFPPARSNAAKGYPMKFAVKIPRAGTLEMTAHIWPKRSADPGYKLGRGKVSDHQGFYFYRHDRLIQDGGWNGFRASTEPHMSLARVEIDVPDALAEFFKVSPNKAKLEASPLFATCMKSAKARASATTFQDYLDTADKAYRKKKPQSAAPMVPPGDGVPAAVRGALDAEGVPRVKGRAMTVTWARLPPKVVFEPRLRRRELVLNSRYRHALLGSQNAGSADLPLMRTLMYLLLEPTFSCKRIGRVERIRLETIQAALLAAVRLEIDRNA